MKTTNMFFINLSKTLGDTYLQHYLSLRSKSQMQLSLPKPSNPLSQVYTQTFVYIEIKSTSFPVKSSRQIRPEAFATFGRSHFYNE